MRSLIRVLVCFAFATVASAQPTSAQPPADVTWETNLTYGNAGDVELKLNLAKPAKHDENAKPIPAIVVIHGGGWAAGHRDHLNAVTWQAAQRGYLAITISYRFAPKHVFPAQIEDVKCAVRYLRANAKKLNIDADRIGATGVSAGAHLSMMLATLDKEDGMEGDGGHADHASKVQAAVSFVGPTELDADDLPQTSKNIVRGFIGGTPEEKSEAYKKASPITYVNKGDAPMLLFQGTVDPLIPNTQAYRMTEAMNKAGVKGRVELILGGGHGWGGKEMERTIDAMFKFFDEFLKR